jgi:hypothetical protein
MRSVPREESGEDDAQRPESHEDRADQEPPDRIE